MTNDSIEAKALALVNELFAESGGSPIDYAALFGKSDIVTFALCRAIEQHKAFKQEVSDALFAYYGSYHNASGEPLERFIIGKPKSDPLVEVLNSLWGDSFSHFNDPEAGQLFRAALDARGLEIREKK
jgi:hypothetical protein